MFLLMLRLWKFRLDDHQHLSGSIALLTEYTSHSPVLYSIDLFTRMLAEYLSLATRVLHDAIVHRKIKR
jgi:hypothetical protein